MKRVALGFRVHTGWAAVVAAGGSARAPVVLARQRVEMIAGHDPHEPPYVYHAAAELPVPAARRFVREQASLAGARASVALETLVGELRLRGFAVVAGGMIGGNQRLTSSLEQLLASHALIHAAEGELYRHALAAACDTLHVPVMTVAAKDLYAHAAKRFGGSTESLRRTLTEAGRAVGKPWAQDQKEALLVGLLALDG